MIYTVTFNPSLDYIVSVDDFKLGLTNRTSSELMLPGGKESNVSIVLKNLGIESTALGFMAGFTERNSKKTGEDGVTSDFIQIEEGISRINLKLKSIDGTGSTEVNHEIPKDKVEELIDDADTMKKEISYSAWKYRRLCRMISTAGSWKELKDKGVMIVVDATRDLLMNVLKYRPFLIKPNNHELGEIFGVTLKTREEVIPYGGFRKKARNVLISMAGEGAVLIAENGGGLQLTGTERHTGQWCRSRRFHGSRIYGRLDGKAGL